MAHTLKQEWCDRDASSWSIIERPDLKLFYDETAEPTPYFYAPVEDGKIMSCFPVYFSTRWQALNALENGDSLFDGYWKDKR